MGWFQKICRNAGLMVHGIKQPIKDDAKARGTKHVTKREVQEKKIDENITLRRTIVEEIEMKPNADKSKLKKEQEADDSQSI
ncbi:MAG: hypothetical protein ACE37H_09875 [Phycisphaeraceae bacterium]